MATVGSTTFSSLIPDLTDNADIQAALKLYHFGSAGYTEVSGQGIWGHLTSLKISPTFSGTVTLPTGTSSLAPLKFVSGTLLSAVQAGAVEFNSANLYFTPSTTRKTIAFTDSNITGTADKAKAVVHYGGSLGTMDYSVPNRKIYSGATPPSSGLAVGDIWMW